MGSHFRGRAMNKLPYPTASSAAVTILMLQM